MMFLFSFIFPFISLFVSPVISPEVTYLIAPTTVPLATRTPTLALTPTRKPTARPTRTPTPIFSFSAPTGEQLDGWFNSYSSYYGVDRNKLWLLAVCESQLNYNASSRDYVGLYQFAAASWITTRKQMNLNHDPALRYNPEESIRTAAFKISKSGFAPWPYCSGKL